MGSRTASRGFTLIEILVVLVITSLTASLLVSGLESTWRNFEKLGARNLKQTAGQLPKLWFKESIEQSILRHPNTVMFSGTASEMTFFTLSPPDTEQPGVYKIIWRIENVAEGHALSFSHGNGQPFTRVGNIPAQGHFEYLSPQGWQTTFTPSDGRVPRAVRLLAANKEWLLAIPVRPVKADTPAELRAFGKYEF